MDSNSLNPGDLHAQVLKLLYEFGEFGKTETGGISRLAAGYQEKEARNHLCRWLTEHGFEVLVDPIGNIFGVLDLGETVGDRAFFCGSHLDSQPNGGNYDGCLGVVCACVAALFLKGKVADKELHPTYRYFVVTCWTGEEGARFQPSLIGSSVFAGTLDLEEAWKLKAEDNVVLRDALIETGYLGSDEAPRPDHYLELHIEQGTLLEEAGDPIGLVEACWGAEKIRLLVKGRADHTGPTPMEDRRNALLAASKVILDVEDISWNSDTTLYSSVGRMELKPNSPNTVVDQAELWIEFRSVDQSALDDAITVLERRLPEIGEQTGCNLDIIGRERRCSVNFDDASISIAECALKNAGIAFQSLNTIAGHDAVRLQGICPSTLLFVPSKDGITHSPAEFTTDEDVCAGFDGMTAVLVGLITLPEGEASAMISRQ